MNPDQLFLQFVRGLFLIMLLFGAGMMFVILFGDSSLGSKMLTIFSSMFVAVLGLGSGYILGRAEAESRERRNGKEDTHDRT